MSSNFALGCGTRAEDSASEREVVDALAAADRARAHGDSQEEARLLDVALSLAPNHVGALNIRGLRALARGELPVAIEALECAAKAAPREPGLWMNLASAYRQSGDDAAEFQSIERALAADQTYFMAWLRKAELHERLGELALATQSWHSVLALARAIPDLPPALVASLARGRAFVAKGMAAFAELVQSEFASDRDALSPAERRRFDACLEAALGRRRVFMNECAGVYFPFLPADEFFDRVHFEWLEELEAKTSRIAAELSSLFPDTGSFRPYIQQHEGTPRNKWTSLDGSPDWGACFLWEYGKQITQICVRCPETVAALSAVPLADIPTRAPTAFFSVLKPHTRIPAHTGVSNTRAIVHLPLVVPDGCGFRVGGETREWKLGEAFVFDDTIEHEAWNDSDQPRVVLIFDVWNPHLTAAERRLLRRFYATADASGHNAWPK